MILSKASKLLHIIRVLRRGGVITADLVALFGITSFLPICPRQHLDPLYFTEIERVQMRALRIIYPRS